MTKIRHRTATARLVPQLLRISRTVRRKLIMDSTKLQMGLLSAAPLHAAQMTNFWECRFVTSA
eukprot:4720959-Amphidinium_carterae.1